MNPREVSGRTRLLTVQHQADAPSGLVGGWLSGSGIRQVVVRPDRGEPLPDSLRGYAGLLVLGGSMGAYDDERAPWLPRVREMLASAVRTALPTLGICLGHQLLTAATGGKVTRHPDGRRMGTVRLRPTPEAVGDPLFGALRPPYRAVRWHQDVVTTPPPDGRVLAIGDGDIHGIRVGDRAWGVQAHPEASPEIVRRWAERTEQGLLTDAVGSGSGGRVGPDGRDGRVAAVRAALADVREREPMLRTVWQPVVEAFATCLLTDDPDDPPRPDPRPDPRSVPAG